MWVSGGGISFENQPLHQGFSCLLWTLQVGGAVLFVALTPHSLSGGLLLFSYGNGSSS